MGYDDSAPSASPKQGHGCFFWGCITSLIILAVIVLAIGGGAYYVYRYMIVGPLKEYSEPMPAPMPPATLPEAERKALHERFDAFADAMKKDAPVEPIVLTADDLNALIEDNPSLKGRAHVVIDGDQIKADISFPLEVLNLSSELKGRYINGSATLRVSLRNGELDVRADSVRTKGKPLPPQFLKAIQDRNLAEGDSKNPEQRERLSKLERIEVKDGKVILTPKKVKKPDGPPGDANAGTDPPAKDTEKP